MLDKYTNHQTNKDVSGHWYAPIHNDCCVEFVSSSLVVAFFTLGAICSIHPNFLQTSLWSTVVTHCAVGTGEISKKSSNSASYRKELLTQQNKVDFSNLHKESVKTFRKRRRVRHSNWGMRLSKKHLSEIDSLFIYWNLALFKVKAPVEDRVGERH